jgi:hypothetical protein
MFNKILSVAFNPSLKIDYIYPSINISFAFVECSITPLLIILIRVLAAKDVNI